MNKGNSNNKNKNKEDDNVLIDPYDSGAKFEDEEDSKVASITANFNDENNENSNSVDNTSILPTALSEIQRIEKKVEAKQVLTPEEARNYVAYKLNDCLTQAVLASAVFGVAGSLFGLAQGVATNSAHFGKQGYFKTVALSSLSRGAQFTAWGSIVSYVNCQLKNTFFGPVEFGKVRKIPQTTVIGIGFVSGFSAGFVLGLSTRSPRQAITSGLLSGVAVGFTHVFD